MNYEQAFATAREWMSILLRNRERYVGRSGPVRVALRREAWERIHNRDCCGVLILDSGELFLHHFASDDWDDWLDEPLEGATYVASDEDREANDWNICEIIRYPEAGE